MSKGDYLKLSLSQRISSSVILSSGQIPEVIQAGDYEARSIQAAEETKPGDYKTRSTHAAEETKQWVLQTCRAQSNEEPPEDDSDEESLDDGWPTPNMGGSMDTRPSAETLAGEFAPLIDALPFCDAMIVGFDTRQDARSYPANTTLMLLPVQ
jgi:hypothetical protein